MANKCAVDVKKDIINTVNKVAVNSRAFSPVQGEDFILQVNNPKQANIVANQINRDYKEGLFRPSYSDPDNFYTIDPSEGLVNRYLQSHSEYLQTSSEDNIPQASPETLKKVNLFLERIGVDVKTLDKIVDSTGQTISANGRANLLKGLIEVVNGKEDKALTEEAMHFAVDIIEQKNKALFNSMLSKVGDYQLYKDIINDNSENSYRNIYKTPEGKPDIRKIKKEVMGKLLAEAVINTDSEKSYPEEKAGIILQWWKQIKDFLANLFSKSNINPFNIAAKEVLSNKEIGKVSNIKRRNNIGVYYQLNNSEDNIEDVVASEKTIREVAARIADRIGMNYRFISDRSQEFKGKIDERGEAVINLAYASLDTPIHEILGHPIIRAIKNTTISKKEGFDLSNFEIKKDYKNNTWYIDFKPGYYREKFKSFLKTGFTDRKLAENSLKNNYSELYQNLLKELEYGKGKEVLDRIKRDYDKKKEFLNTKYDLSIKNGFHINGVDYGDYGLLEPEYFKQEGYNNKVTISEEEYLKAKKQHDDFINSDANRYTLEEQQEEAIVELLGLMTAEKLDKVKDGKLISLLKRLLKEIKQFMKSLLKQKEVDVDKLPDDMTIGDLSDLLAYSNNKLILPGYEVVYTTPDNQQFKTYQEASNHISDLAKSVEDVDLSDKILNLNTSNSFTIFDKYGSIVVTRDSFEEAEKYAKETNLPHGYRIQNNNENSLNQFIEKNREYEQSQEIIDEWKRVNNIQYNPEEIYSRGQGFYSIVGAYSEFDVKLMFQNLLHHIEDNQKAGGEFTISAFTRSVDKKLGHMEGEGGKIRFKIFPTSDNIKWAANTDVYSGSVWDASKKVSKDKKSELLGVSYTKAPSLRNINEIQPNLASIVDNINHVHNELGISLTGNNFRFEWDDNIPYPTIKLLKSINSILDEKFGKLVRPEIKETRNFEGLNVSYKGDNSFKTVKSYESDIFRLYDISNGKETITGLKANEFNFIDKVTKGIQPTQTNETLKESIEGVKNNLLSTANRPKSLEELQEGDGFIYFEENGKYFKEDLSKQEDIEITKEEYEGKKEYTEQALINTKIAKLKEVAKKYPRSLIRSEVKSIDGRNTQFEQDDEFPFSKLSTNLDKQTEIDSKLMSTQKEVTKEYAKEEATDDEADNWYERAGKRVKNRVTDLVKKLTNYHPTDKQKKDNEVKRSNGVSGHLDFERIIDSYVDPITHNLRPQPLEIDSESAIGNRVGFERMKQYIQDLINQHSPDSKFYSEIVVYDEKHDRAGTIDFLVVDRNGKTNIYDWKFLSIKQGENDVPYYKQDAATTQIREYRRILKDEYGVKEFGETRAIPIIMEYYTDYRAAPFLTAMKIGSADTSKIEEIKYLPIPVDEETGIPALDKKIKQLVNLYNKESRKPVKEGRRDLKAQKLNTIKQTIRILRAQTNLYVFKDTMQVNAGEMQQIIDNYNNNIKGKNPNDLSDEEKSDFAYSIKEQLSVGEMYKDIDTSFDTEIKGKVENGDLSADQAKELRETLNSAASEVRINMDKLKKIQQEFADVFVAQSNNITGLLKPEKIFRGFFSRFTGMTKIPLKSLNLLYQMATNADENARMDALRLNERIFELRKKVLEWSKSKGIKDTKIFDKLYKKSTTGDRVHKLIDEIKPEFYKELKENAEQANRHWFETNINLDTYRKEARIYYNERKAQIENTVYPGSAEHQIYREAEDIKKLDEEYDVDNPAFSGWNNFIMRRHIKDRAKWYTKEYKGIINTPLEELYKVHQEVNKFASDIGYIEARTARTFTPFLRKTLTDKIIWGGNPRPVQDFIDDLSIGSNTSSYGETDENGDIIPSIPKYYTSDIGEKKTDEQGNTITDYTNVSEDMFRNLIAFNTQIHKYKYFSDIEGQIELIKTIEEFKGHLETDKFGNIKKVQDTGENEVKGVGDASGNVKNFSLLDDFVNTIIYKQRYVQSTSDTAISIGIKGLINKVAGREIFSAESTPDKLSMIKTIDALNRGVRLKVLALNPLSGIAVAFGNNLQVAAQSGEYFTYRNYLANQNKILRQDFQTEKDKEVFSELINTFLPLDKDLSTELYNKAGVRSLSRRTIGDILMIFMAKPDEVLEKSVFLSVLDNLMIVDGKFVNINKYVKDKYPNRNLSGAERNRTQPLIKKEIQELKASSSISKIAKVNKEGKLEIPGFDVNNRKEIIRVAQLAKSITRNANGNISEFNKTQNQMNVFTASAMVFRNWIPTLTSTRFAQLHKTADTFEGARYDVGRVRLMGRILIDSITSKALLLSHVLNMNDKGLNYINELFEKYKAEYQNRTGEEFEMDKDEFIDLIHNNIRNEVKELSFLIGLTSAMLSLGVMMPPDDDKRGKNLHAIVYRTLDKMQNELSFFYDPRSVIDLTNGSIFPSTQIFTDIWKFGDSIRGEIFDDEEENKNNRPLKRFAKLLPVGSAWITYVGVVDPDLAKYLQVNIPTTSQTYH